jgi:tetratricopeptide (TPR) repeat protein
MNFFKRFFGRTRPTQPASTQGTTPGDPPIFQAQVPSSFDTPLPEAARTGDTATWPLVLQEAEKARGLVSDKRTREDGMRLFDQLTKEYPRDGMVYFKRAEASEALGEEEKASNDYKKAEEFFKKDLWRELARSRAEHLDENLRSRQLRQRVHVALGPRAVEFAAVEDSAWLAGTFTKKSAFASLELSRTALVRAIIALEDPRGGPRSAWAQRLDRFNQYVTLRTAQETKWVLVKRNDAVYSSHAVSREEAERAFNAVLDFLSEAVGRKRKA